MKKRTALIIYSSITGNTERIAEAFAETFREYNIEPTLMKLEGKYLGEQIPEPDRNSYDFLVMGSPVIASLPYHDLYIQFGAQEDYERRSFASGLGPILGALGPGDAGGPGGPGPGGPGFPGPGQPTFADGVPMGGIFNFPETKQHRILFCTYGGYGQGPTSAISTLELLKEMNQGTNVVGMFACPGKIMYHDASKELSKLLQINQYRAQEMIARYKAGKMEYFAEMPADQVEMIRKAALETPQDSYSEPTMAENDPLGIGMPGSKFWSYDLQNRPNDRDIYMAKAFLQDIIEDYYLSDTGEPRKAGAVYYSIN